MKRIQSELSSVDKISPQNRQKFQRGKWNSFNRIIIITGNNGIHVISLNMFERMIKSIVGNKLFFKCHHLKNVKIISKKSLNTIKDLSNSYLRAAEIDVLPTSLEKNSLIKNILKLRPEITQEEQIHLERMSTITLTTLEDLLVKLDAKDKKKSQYDALNKLINRMLQGETISRHEISKALSRNHLAYASQAVVFQPKNPNEPLSPINPKTTVKLATNFTGRADKYGAFSSARKDSFQAKLKEKGIPFKEVTPDKKVNEFIFKLAVIFYKDLLNNNIQPVTANYLAEIFEASLNQHFESVHGKKEANLLIAKAFLESLLEKREALLSSDDQEDLETVAHIQKNFAVISQSLTKACNLLKS